MTEEAKNLPTAWDARLAKDAQNVASTEVPKIPQISLKGGIMAYQGVAVPGNKLSCIILGSAFQHRWYEAEFDPNKPATPACFALSLDGDNMTPHADSPKIQSETCETCDNFKWGSDPKGGRGKACKAGRRFTILPALAVQQGGVKKAEMAMLTCPVTSVRNWANYVNRIASEYRRPPYAMLTEISLHPHAKTQIELKFDAIGIVEDEESLGEIVNRLQMSETILMAPYEFSESAERPAADPNKKAKY